MCRDPGLHYLADCLAVALMKIQNIPPNSISWQGRKSGADTGGLAAKAIEKCKLAHCAEFQGGSDIRFRQSLLQSFWPSPSEQFSSVHFDRIMLGRIGSKDRESSIQTLQAATAVGMLSRDTANVRATDGVRNQP